MFSSKIWLKDGVLLSDLSNYLAFNWNTLIWPTKLETYTKNYLATVPCIQYCLYSKIITKTITKNLNEIFFDFCRNFLKIPFYNKNVVLGLWWNKKNSIIFIYAVCHTKLVIKCQNSLKLWPVPKFWFCRIVKYGNCWKKKPK